MAKRMIFDSKKQAETTIPVNQIRKILIDDQVICLARTPNGFFAFEKNCPHMTDDLSRGKLNPRNEIVCPWHAYRFNLATGEESERRCGDLKTYCLLWEEEELYILI